MYAVVLNGKVPRVGPFPIWLTALALKSIRASESRRHPRPWPMWFSVVTHKTKIVLGAATAFDASKAVYTVVI